VYFEYICWKFAGSCKHPIKRREVSVKCNASSESNATDETKLKSLTQKLLLYFRFGRCVSCVSCILLLRFLRWLSTDEERRKLVKIMQEVDIENCIYNAFNKRETQRCIFWPTLYVMQYTRCSMCLTRRRYWTQCTDISRGCTSSKPQIRCEYHTTPWRHSHSLKHNSSPSLPTRTKKFVFSPIVSYLP